MDFPEKRGTCSIKVDFAKAGSQDVTMLTVSTISLDGVQRVLTTPLHSTTDVTINQKDGKVSRLFIQWTPDVDISEKPETT